MQIVEVLANTKYSAFAMHVAREGVVNGGFGEGALEDFPRSFSHESKFLFSFHSVHWGIIGSDSGICEPRTLLDAKVAKDAQSSQRKPAKKVILGIRLFANPRLDRFAQLAQSSFKEMIGSFD